MLLVGAARRCQPISRRPYALAAGDFDGDDVSDLAIGAPVEPEALLNEVGTVTIVYGALFADGFEDAGVDYWTASIP